MALRGGFSHLTQFNFDGFSLSSAAQAGTGLWRYGVALATYLGSIFVSGKAR